MSSRKSFVKPLCAGALVVLACGSTSALAQTSEYYVSGQGSGITSVLQGGGVNRSWTQVNGTAESPIAVSADVYTTAFQSPGDFGGQYQYDGTDTGGRPVHPGGVGAFYDSTSDGRNNYIVEFGAGGGVYSTDLDYANPVLLFTVNFTYLGITWDSSSNTLWLSEWGGGGTINNYDMAGNLLSSFPSAASLNTALGYDHADGTLWVGDRGPGDTFYQYDTAGNQLSSMVVPGVAGHNNLGGDFAVPAPGTLALASLGFVFAGRRRR